MKDFDFFSIKDLIQSFRDRTASPNDIAYTLSKRIKRHNETLNAFVYFDEEAFLKSAEESTSNIQLGIVDDLSGIFLGVKDNFCMNGIRTTNGSKMLHNYVPVYNSTITNRLMHKGAIFSGKTNQDEFAMGSSTKTSYFGPTLSPWKLDGENLNCGGSSGGSAAAVAAGFCNVAIGTDTGGSVRQPAAFCGVVGYKPTYGSCSRFGIIPYASSFDQVGFFARHVSDVATMYNICKGSDGHDMMISSSALPDVSFGERKKYKIGIVKEWFENQNISQANSEILASIEELKKHLAKEYEIREVSIPNLKYSLNIYNTVSRTEAASNFAKYDGVKYGYKAEDETVQTTREEGFGSEVKNRILVGTGILLEEYRDIYQNMINMRGQVKSEFTDALSEVDFLISPVSPTLPPKQSESISQEQMYLQDIFTLPVNVTGLPAISLPTKLSSDKRPMAVQIVGGAFKDGDLLEFASQIQSHYQFLQSNKLIIKNNISCDEY